MEWYYQYRDIAIAKFSRYYGHMTIWSNKSSGQKVSFLKYICSGPLCFGTISVKRTKTESTIWLNLFLKSVFAACFKVKRVHCSCDQPIIRCFPRLRTTLFTLNEYSELVYCMCCELECFLEHYGHQLCFIFITWYKHFTRFVVTRCCFFYLFPSK